MTNPTQHGQVPDALRLAEEITNLECSSEAAAKTIAAAADELCRLHVENASLRASPTPPALSAAPAAFLKSVIALCSNRGYSPANIEAWDKNDKWIADLWRQAEAMLAASPTPPAEQPAITSESGAVYAELPEEHWLSTYTTIVWNEDSMRDFADRTHALRMEQAASSAVLKAIHEANMQLVRTGDDAFMLVPYKLATAEQAAPKAEPTWPSESLVWEALQAYLKHDTNMEGMRAALIVGAAPQQHAPKAAQEEMDKEASNARLDIDSNSTEPEQQRDVACSLEVGQHVGNGEHQEASCKGSKDSELLKIAARNLKYFIEHAQFSSFADKRAALNCLDALAAPKAAPGEPSDAEIDAFLDSPGGIEWVIADKRERYRLLVRAVLAKWAAPQQEAQEPAAFIHWPINGPPRLVWYSQKALNDAILKTHEDGYKPDVKLYTAPQPAPAAQGDAPTDSGPISRQWLTVVYRGVEAGDEVQQICTHPKVSAMSWSHALHDRDAARKQGANHD